MDKEKTGLALLVDKYTVPALTLLALGLLLGFYGWWMFTQGSTEKERKMMAAIQVLKDKNDQANREALAEINRLSVLRARAETEILKTVEGSRNADDDDPAPAVVQRAFDGLRVYRATAGN